MTGSTPITEPEVHSRLGLWLCWCCQRTSGGQWLRRWLITPIDPDRMDLSIGSTRCHWVHNLTRLIMTGVLLLLLSSGTRRNYSRPHHSRRLYLSLFALFFQETAFLSRLLDASIWELLLLPRLPDTEYARTFRTRLYRILRVRKRIPWLHCDSFDYRLVLRECSLSVERVRD